MKVLEMRAFLKGRGIIGYSTLKKSKLKEEVEKIQQEDKRAEYERQLRENALCHACLNQQRIQRKIDDKRAEYERQRYYELTVRNLVCIHCKHVNLAQDGDHTVCVDCGALQPPDAVPGYRPRSSRLK